MGCKCNWCNLETEYYNDEWMEWIMRDGKYYCKKCTLKLWGKDEIANKIERCNNG